MSVLQMTPDQINTLDPTQRQSVMQLVSPAPFQAAGIVYYGWLADIHVQRQQFLGV